MLCCGNVLQNTHTNNETNKGAVFLKTMELRGCLWIICSNLHQPGRCTMFFRAPGSSCFIPTNTQSWRTSDSVALRDARLEHSNGLLKCSDPLSRRFQKKTLQHTSLLISPLRAFHLFSTRCLFTYLAPQLMPDTFPSEANTTCDASFH